MRKVERFENQIESLLPMIRDTVNGYVYNSDHVNDLTQEVVIRLLKTKTIPKQLNSWLRVVIRNTVTDFWRQETKENQYRNKWCTVDTTGIRYSGNNQTWLCEPAVNEECVDWNVMPAIKTALERLGKPARQSLLLHVSGYGYEEIAAITKVSIGTVRSRLHYAKKRAKELLAEYR
jgi:RNA polymerase sigma-70 factor (ECF subfamily)